MLQSTGSISEDRAWVLEFCWGFLALLLKKKKKGKVEGTAQVETQVSGGTVEGAAQQTGLLKPLGPVGRSQNVELHGNFFLF